jgi:hypothetical protein
MREILLDTETTGFEATFRRLGRSRSEKRVVGP